MEMEEKKDAQRKEKEEILERQGNNIKAQKKIN